MELTFEEIRVLGVLVEKAATTPDQYPLSTNALTNGCNQKTSRDPVVDYDQRTTLDTMLLLRPAGLARTVISGRTEKHRHILDEAWDLEPAALAVLAVLMLRGAQSPGELRTRTDRAHGFGSLDEVELVLADMARRDEPLVRNLGRGPGQSQDRWIHLLGGTSSASGEAELSAPAAPATSAPLDTTTVEAASRVSVVAPTGSAVAEFEARIAQLEARIARLESELGL